VAVDTHVHLHAGFDRGRFLDAAMRNAALAGLDRGPVWLLMTESRASMPMPAFRTTHPRAGAPSPGRWPDHRPSGPDGAQVLVTAGRQVQVEGGLELLLLGAGGPVPDGIDMREALARAKALGALPVIPWGFGKWWGRRGRALHDLLESPDGDAVHLGDNGGRAAFWPRPPLFERVEAAGRRVLPGSDPLPFPDQVARVGSYGLVATLDIQAPEPFAALRARLADPAIPMPPYGRRAGALAFVRDQLAMQLVKRRRA
jgi:hypothetical protein